MGCSMDGTEGGSLSDGSLSEGFSTEESPSHGESSKRGNDSSESKGEEVGIVSPLGVWDKVGIVSSLGVWKGGIMSSVGGW